MQKVKLFRNIESELGNLEAEINDWISRNKVKVISLTGNIAPQPSSPDLATGSFSASDVLVVVLYEDGNG